MKNNTLIKTYKGVMVFSFFEEKPYSKHYSHALIVSIRIQNKLESRTASNSNPRVLPNKINIKIMIILHVGDFIVSLLYFCYLYSSVNSL